MARDILINSRYGAIDVAPVVVAPLDGSRTWCARSPCVNGSPRRSSASRPSPTARRRSVMIDFRMRSCEGSHDLLMWVMHCIAVVRSWDAWTTKTSSTSSLPLFLYRRYIAQTSPARVDEAVESGFDFTTGVAPARSARMPWASSSRGRVVNLLDAPRAPPRVVAPTGTSPPPPFPRQVHMDKLGFLHHFRCSQRYRACSRRARIDGTPPIGPLELRVGDARVFARAERARLRRLGARSVAALPVTFVSTTCPPLRAQYDGCRPRRPRRRREYSLRVSTAPTRAVSGSGSGLALMRRGGERRTSSRCSALNARQIGDDPPVLELGDEARVVR